MNLNKGCIEMHIVKECKVFKCVMNLNKGCIEMKSSNFGRGRFKG